MKKRLFGAPIALTVGLFTAMVFGGTGVSADDIVIGTCGDNATWKLECSTGTLTVSGTGDMDNFEYHKCPWYLYYSEIKSVVIGDGITSIGEYALKDAPALTTVTV